jgi:hypothetical protein
MTSETILAIGLGVRAAPTPFVPGMGQSFTLRSQDPNAKCSLLNVFSSFANPSGFSIRSPRMHDNVRGIAYSSSGNLFTAMGIDGIQQPMVQQDNIQVVGDIGGNAAAWDSVWFTIYYENLIGASGNFYKYDDIKNRIKNLLTVPITVVPSAVGDWAPFVTINSSIDLFKANTDYAILGVESNSYDGMIGIQGPCTGNVIFGIPAVEDARNYNPNFCVQESIMTGLPTIPVMQSADKAATFVTISSAAVAFPSAIITLAELG